MVRFVIKRIFFMIPTILCVAILVFSIMFLVPGDVADTILGQDASEIELQSKREMLGLNDPYFVQLGKFLYRFFIKFDMGKSWVNFRDIASEIRDRAPRTFILSLACMVIQILVGIPLGVVAAVKQDRIVDRIILIITIALISIPGFWLAMILINTFAVNLGWFPVYGMREGLKAYVLPVIANSMGGIATMMRQTRSCMLEVIRSDYVFMARAKGLSETKVLFKHALPNGMIPLLTILGGGLASSLGGSLIIENVFAIPGMGLYLNTAVQNRDFAVVRTVVLILAILFCFVMILVDVGYGFADPRIRAQYVEFGTGKKKAGAKHA